MDEIAKLVHSFFLAMILDTKNRWAGLAWICSYGMDKTANAVLSFLVDSKITLRERCKKKKGKKN